MIPEFVNILCCPDTRSELDLIVERDNEYGLIEQGDLVNQNGKKYPIINGVPRFVAKESYTRSFGLMDGSLVILRITNK